MLVLDKFNMLTLSINILYNQHFIMRWSHVSHVTYVKDFGVSNDDLLVLHEPSDEIQPLELVVGQQCCVSLD